MEQKDFKPIAITPEELNFNNMIINKLYSASVTIQNNMAATVELNFRASSPEKIELSSKSKTLAPYEAFNLEVKAKTTKPFPKKGRKSIAFRETIFIKSQLFDQRLIVHLCGEEVEELRSSSVHPSPIKTAQPLKKVKSIEENIKSSEYQIEIEELKAKIQNYENERKYYQNLNKSMSEKVPEVDVLIDEALSLEREKQERQNSKVLNILSIKDNLITSLQQSLVEKDNKLSQLNALLEAKTTEYELKLKEERERQQPLKELIEKDRSHLESIQSAMSSDKGKIEALQLKMQSLISTHENELIHIKELNSEYESKIMELSKKLTDLLNEVDSAVTLCNKNGIAAKTVKDIADSAIHNKAQEVANSKKKTKEDFKQINVEISELTKQNTNMKIAMEEQKSALDKLQYDKVGLSQELNTLMDQIKIKQQPAVADTQTIDELNQEHDLEKQKLLEQINLLESQQKQQETQINSLQLCPQKLQKAKAKIKLLKTYLRSAKISYDKLCDTIAIEATLPKLKPLVEPEENDSWTRIEKVAMQDQMKQKAFECVQHLKDLERSNNYATQLKEEIQKKEGEATALNSKIGSLLKENESLKEQSEIHLKALRDVENIAYKDQTDSKQKKGDGIILQLTTPTSNIHHKLAKMIIDAKISEAQSIIKLKETARSEIETRNNATKQKEKYMPSQPNQLQKRIIELESQLEEIKIKQCNTTLEFDSKPNYTADSQILTNSSNEINPLIDAVTYLCVTLANIECYLKDKNITIPYSCHCATNEAFVEVEYSQRIIIRALYNALYKQNQKSSPVYSPNNEGDKKIWYLELLETQTDLLNSSISSIKSFTEKLTIEITGSLQSAAQVKSASLELSTSMRVASEELYMLRNIMHLLKSDVEPLGNIRCTTSKPDGIISEKMKASLQNEMTSQKLEFENEITKMKEDMAVMSVQQEKLEASLNETMQKNIILEREKEEMRLLIDESENYKKKAEVEIENIRLDKNEAVQKYEEIKTQTSEAQSSLKKIIDTKEHTIKQLQLQIDEYATQITQCKLAAQGNQTTEMLQKEISQLESTLLKERANKNNEIDKLQTECSIYIGQVSDLKSQIEKTHKECEEKLTKSLIDEKTMKHSKHRKYKEEISKLQTDISIFKEKEVENKKTSNEYNQHIAQIEAEVENERKQNEELSKIIKKQEKLISKPNNMIAREISDTKACLEVLEQEKERLINEMLAKDKEQSRVTKQLRDAQLENETKTIEIQKILEDMESTNLKHQKDIKQSYESTQTVKDMLKELQIKYEQALNELDSERARQSELSQKIAQAQKGKSNIEGEIVSLQKLNSEQEEQIQALKEQYQAIINENQKNLSEIKEEMGKLKSKDDSSYKQYQSHIAILKQQLDDQQLSIVDRKRSNSVEKVSSQNTNYEAIINSLKSRLNTESTKAAKLKTKNIQLREAVSQLKKDIEFCEKSKSKKPLNKTQESIIRSQIDYIDLLTKFNEQSNSKTKLEVSLAEINIILRNKDIELKELQDKTTKIFKSLQNAEQNITKANETKESLKKENIDALKRKEAECRKHMDEIASIKDRWVPKEEHQKVFDKLKDCESNVKTLKDQLNKKTDAYIMLKEKEDKKTQECNAAQAQLEALKTETEKLKKSIKELAKKDDASKSFKDIIETLKQSEKKLIEDNVAYQEKIKALRQDVLVRDNLIKTYKDKSSEISNAFEESKISYQESEKMKEANKKIKSSLERKDTHIKTMKAKIDSLTAENATLNKQLEKTKETITKKPTMQPQTNTQELNKLKADSQSMEFIIQTLVVFIKKIIREIYTSMESTKPKEKKDQSLYTEGMNILQMSEADIKELVEGQNDDWTSIAPHIDKLDQIMAYKESIGEIMNNIIETATSWINMKKEAN